MPDIFWLASYPKSGNTWIRILLANYQTAERGPVDINALALHGMVGGFDRATFDSYVGIKSSCLSSAVVERLRPAVYRAMAREAAAPLFIKVHDAWTLTDRGEPVYPREVTAGVVYILRNVLDVAASAASHWGVTIEEAVHDLCDTCKALSSGRNRLSVALPQQLRSWTGHIRSWIEESKLPVHVVRYEDLMADTTGAFDKVLAFCRLDRDGEKLRRAVSHSRFEVLREMERTVGFRERPPHARGRFFRRGEIGSWREEVPSDLVRKLIDAHGDMMHRFGYINDKGFPVESL